MIYDIDTNFQGNGMPKQNVLYDCFSMIMLDSVITVNEKHYSQTLLGKCKYKIKKSKKKNWLNINFDSNLSDESI